MARFKPSGRDPSVNLHFSTHHSLNTEKCWIIPIGGCCTHADEKQTRAIIIFGWINFRASREKARVHTNRFSSSSDPEMPAVAHVDHRRRIMTGCRRFVEVAHDRSIRRRRIIILLPLSNIVCLRLCGVATAGPSGP